MRLRCLQRVGAPAERHETRKHARVSTRSEPELGDGLSKLRALQAREPPADGAFGARHPAAGRGAGSCGPRPGRGGIVLARSKRQPMARHTFRPEVLVPLADRRWWNLDVRSPKTACAGGRLCRRRLTGVSARAAHSARLRATWASPTMVGSGLVGCCKNQTTTVSDVLIMCHANP